MRVLRILALCLIVAVPVAAEERILDLSRSVEGVTSVVVAAGVGDVEITGGADNDMLTARVELSPKRGFWGSRSRRAVERAELQVTAKGDTLTLRISPRDGDHSFGEKWTLHLPARLRVSVDLGVGDVTVLDTSGDIKVGLGVGDVRIEGEHSDFGSIRASSGVGDTVLSTPDGREHGDGFVGHSLHQRGPGTSTIEVSIGVGDSMIRLR
ncbi:MAG: hypothetical protein KA072_07155 [Thermoanaerobaculaceae bacterium]|nr:hypothetical protein [Thermoanaerobaculaceae bacterium]MDI9622470.1 hypothetical protein [Acidobacteriota bacterium]NLH09775.1 hypothetical protein [Holophagae bacterium]